MHRLIGTALSLLGWYLPRVVAQTRFRWDMGWRRPAPTIVGFAVSGVTLAPVSSGFEALPCGGFAFTDRSRGSTLLQARSLFRHNPRCANSFATATSIWPRSPGPGALSSSRWPCSFCSWSFHLGRHRFAG